MYGELKLVLKTAKGKRFYVRDRYCPICGLNYEQIMGSAEIYSINGVVIWKK